MKKISAFILAVTMLLFTSCGKSDGAAGGEVETPEAAETTTTTATAAEVTTTTTAKVENTAKTGELTIDDKIALKSANVNAKTAYNATAMYLSEQETNGFTFEESLSDKFFADGTTEGIDLEAERPAAEGDSIVYDAMKKADVESGLICVKKCKIDDFDSFMVQFKTKEGWIGQYPDSITVENAAKVKWGEFLPYNTEKATSAETTTTTVTTATPEESAAEEDTLKDRNGFDTKTNITFKDGGLVYSIPNYYNRDDTGFEINDSIGFARIVISSTYNSDSETVDEDYLKTYIDSLEKFNMYGDIGCDSYAGQNAYFVGVSHINNAAHGVMVFIDNKACNCINQVFFMQSNAEYEYLSDLQRILNSIQIDKSYKPEKTDSSKEEKKNSSPVTITNTYLSKDYSGNSVLVVEYKWTNFSDSEAYFGLLFNDKVYQNGVECKTAYFCDDVDAQALLTTVQPGATFTVKEAYTLRDSSQVQIVVKPLWSFTDEKYLDVKLNLK